MNKEKEKKWVTNAVNKEKEKKWVTNAVNKEKKERWQGKAQHGYLFQKSQENQTIIDQTVSNMWLTKGRFSSQIEGYLCSIREQEIATNILYRLREKDPSRRKRFERNCRTCGIADEDIFHIIASCPYISSNLHLHYRHNPVAKALYNEIITEVGSQEDAKRYKYYVGITSSHNNRSRGIMVGLKDHYHLKHTP